MTALRQPALLMLLVLALVLLPFGRLVEVPLGILSIAACVLLWRRPAIERVSLHLLLALYAAFTLPMLFALPDAVAMEKSTMSTIGTLRYGLSAYAMLALVSLYPAQRPRVLDGLGLAAAVVLALWSLDGLWQFYSGENVLGYGLGRGYVNGLFGEDDNIKLGISVALFLPLALVYGLRSWPFAVTGSLLLLLLSVIVLSGKRAAWVTVGIELAVLSAYYFYRGRFSTPRVILLGVAAVVVLGLNFASSDWVRERSLALADVLENPDYDTVNRASGERLPLWDAALRMGGDNWLNGVGPRGFRYAYAAYAAPGDRWAEPMRGGPGTRSSHAHQVLLDIFSETGAIGLAGFAAMVLLLLRAWHRAEAAARSRALPFAAALVGMLFPINTHPSWYSSWSALLLWLFIGLFLYALADVPGPGREPSPGASTPS